MRRDDTYCGLYCGSCGVLKANEEGKLEELAEKWGDKPEELICEGCKSGVNSVYCADCDIKKCNIEKGYENCGECPDFPCALIQDFNDDRYSHHSVVIRNLTEIKTSTVSSWLQKQQERWKCSKCGKKFSWYDEVCEECGEELYNSNKEEADLPG